MSSPDRLRPIFVSLCGAAALWLAVAASAFAAPPDPTATDQTAPVPSTSTTLRGAEEQSMQAQAERERYQFRMSLEWPWIGRITTYFGEVGPTSPRGHAGLDIAGSYGDPVVAPADGVVLLAGWSPAYGNNVILDHGNGYTTRYGHFTDVAVQEGESVTRGQLIGHIGSTGYSTGPHLHFEVHFDDALLDPLTLLPSPHPRRPYDERPESQTPRPYQDDASMQAR
jgi:murein DD-endopeptidase MepM/ murein hydrolase activator NlpD